MWTLARQLPPASPDRAALLEQLVDDSLAEYAIRAQAARLAAPHPVSAVSGTELALLSSASITPEAAARPYQVEARLDVARQSSIPGCSSACAGRRWRSHLATPGFACAPSKRQCPPPR